MAAPREGALVLPPGLVLREGLAATEGRWSDADHVRFVRGLPEKIGGFQVFSASAMVGVARGAIAWTSLDGQIWIAVGTNNRVYVLNTAGEPQELTPIVNEITPATDVLSTVNLSNVITVNFPSHQADIGQEVILASDPPGGSVGGLPIDGMYAIVDVVDSDHFKIDSPAGNATSTVTNGGGDVDIFILLAPGTIDPVFARGYGAGRYGRGLYGTPRETSTLTLLNRWWSFGTLGQMLFACPYGAAIHFWDPSVDPIERFQPLTAAPFSSSDAPGAAAACFTTDERFLVALGASPDTGIVRDPMLLRWSDQNDPSYWTAGINHTANARRLQAGNKLLAGTKFQRLANLIWSDTALYLMIYTGGAGIYETRVVGQECGLIGPYAFVVAADSAFWMGENSLWMFNGGAVQRIPNSDDIGEWFWKQARPVFNNKAHACYVPKFNEVWFFFVPNDQAEPTTYVSVRLDDWVWSKGTFTRTTVVRLPGKQNPLMVALDGFLYEHENGLDAADEPLRAYIKSGPNRIDEGNREVDVWGFFPDMQRQVGDMSITINARDRARSAVSDTQTATFGPTEEVIDLHVSGRMVDFELVSDVIGGDFRIGKHSFETSNSGGRR